MITAEENTGVLTVTSFYQAEKKLPFIRLRGLWLKNLGFECGDKVQVEERPGKLVIQVISKAIQES